MRMQERILREPQKLLTEEVHRQSNRELERNQQDRLRLLDLWTFQKEEIEDAKLQSGAGDERLEAKKRVLANAEKICRLCHAGFRFTLRKRACRHLSILAHCSETSRRTGPL